MEPDQLRGVSDFDTRHQINSNWVYDLPFGRANVWGHDLESRHQHDLGGCKSPESDRWTSGFHSLYRRVEPGTPTSNYPGNAVLTGAVKPETDLRERPAVSFDIGAAAERSDRNFQYTG